MTDETENSAPSTSTPAVAPPVKRIEVRNVINDAELKQDVEYSLVDLSNAMQKQAGLVVHYHRLSAQAERQVDDLKMMLEATESVVYRRLIDQAATSGVKLTEARLERMLAADKRVLTVKRALNEAKQIAAVAHGATRAMEHRKDMLVQHGADGREERQRELRTMASPGHSGAAALQAVQKLAK